MSRPKFIDDIRKLKIPSKCKAELAMLYAKCRRLAAAVVRFVKAHKRFGEAMILGCVVAWLLAQAPWIGGFLGLCALVTSAAIGLMNELREEPPHVALHGVVRALEAPLRAQVLEDALRRQPRLDAGEDRLVVRPALARAPANPGGRNGRFWSRGLSGPGGRNGWF